MATNISIGLSEKSIRQAITQYETWKNLLIQKNDEFVRRLSELGIEVARVTLEGGQGDSSRDSVFAFEIMSNGAISSMRMKVTNEDILFWEFGAGIYYNNGNFNPKASQLGYGVGTYPGQTHALNPSGWWYSDESGNLHHSLGTEATMPMYNATLAVISNIRKIAREVFGGSSQ